MIYDLEL